MNSSDKYYRDKTHKYFNSLHGELYDEQAKQTITNGELIRDKRPIDHYRLGAVYLHNAKELPKAHKHFSTALKKIIANESEDATFIIDRIDHFRDYFVDYDVEELPIELAANINHQRQKQNNIKQLEEKKQISSDDVAFTQKVLLAKQQWQSDSQNVHDSAIFSILDKQLNTVINDNAQIPNITEYQYSDAIKWLQDKYAVDPDKREKLTLVINNLALNYPTNGVKEQDIITAIWRRAHDPENASCIEEIKNSLGESMLDCVEGNGLVCMAGRTSKYWQALARLDKDPDIGVLKSKQALKNEIYEKSAKIVNDYLSDASDELKLAYQKGNISEQVTELSNSIKEEIGNIKNQYTHLSNDEVIPIIEECLAVV
jgi:hypothetical protein